MSIYICLCFSIYQSNQCLISISTSNNGLSIWQFVSMYVIHQPLFVGAGTGIYPYAATQLYTRLKGNHAIVVLCGHEFPYPPSQQGITNLSLDETFWLIQLAKIALELLFKTHHVDTENQKERSTTDPCCDVRYHVICQNDKITCLIWFDQIQIWRNKHSISIECLKFRHWC